MNDSELFKTIDKLKSTMIAVATGGPRIADVQDEFSAAFDVVDAELRRRLIPNALPYRELWDWYGRWSSGDLPSYKSRRNFVNKITNELIYVINATTRPSPILPSATYQPSGETAGWDVFVSHASEDKDSFARPLAERLRFLGLGVWFDETTLTLGDSLRRSIDNGLAHARFGVVVISPNFLRKEWPQKELDGLAAREIGGLKVILPILHEITPAEVRKVSPMLADKLGAMSSAGVNAVADQILRVVRPHRQDTPAPAAPIAPTSRSPVSDPAPYAGHSSEFFASRFARAFPGVRAIQWFDDPAAIRTRLLRLLEPPLTFDHATPVWWWRDGNLQIEEFSIQPDGRYLMDVTELDIRRIAAAPGRSYWRSFVYVEAAGLPPSGAYAPNAGGSKNTIDNFGYDYEEYGLVDGKHVVTRAEYDDGSAMIDGELQDIHGRADLRVRHLTPYNFLIAANGSPVNNPAFDQTLEERLNAILETGQGLEGLAAEIWRFPRPRRHDRD